MAEGRKENEPSISTKEEAYAAFVSSHPADLHSPNKSSLILPHVDWDLFKRWDRSQVYCNGWLISQKE